MLGLVSGQDCLLRFLPPHQHAATKCLAGIGVVVRVDLGASLGETVFIMLNGVGRPILILSGIIPSKGNPGLCGIEKVRML